MNRDARTFIAFCSDAALVRLILTSRVRLLVQERHHRLLWRAFTITGPNEVIDAVIREVEAELDGIAMDARVW